MQLVWDNTVIISDKEAKIANLLPSVLNLFVVSICRNIRQFKFNLYSDSSQKVNDLKRFETEMSSQMALLLYTNTTAWQLSDCKKMHCRRVALIVV